MRIRLVKGKTVERYARGHANGRMHFERWLTIIGLADWTEPADITQSYNGNLLGGNYEGYRRVVFDLGGGGPNSFRMICQYKFGTKRVHLYINWIGTHEEYNRLTEAVKRTISVY